ncbi:MAG TPA: MarR family transcriptional regulator [Longimicrobiales bacterium]|nr:MarR family transcriptional regulator [Longimicrobiales bacterium]
MTTSLRDDIQQRAAFTSLEQEASLNLIRTATQLTDSIDLLLKQKGLGPGQYNVLRILRGAEADGICRNDLRDRMLTRMPDMTRLLDRMEEAGLVVRTRDVDDRRMVLARITPAGRKLVDELDGPTEELHQRQLGHLTDEQLRTLIDLLTLVRQRV